MNYLNIDEKLLKESNSFNTAFEITSQPNIWRNLVNDYENKKEDIENFFNKIGLNKDFSIIFTGAGTSEYVGNVLEPLLNNMQEYDFRSCASTDIVNNPLMYLKKEKKTLLISFARSGDSPESLASINLANKLVDNVYHLFITCNKDGQLAKISKENDNIFLFMMPEGTNDKGFAMTSSFSSMLLSIILIFLKPNNILESIETAEKELYSKVEKIKEIAYKKHSRIIYLGSGPFKGLTQELTLKVMELSAGIPVAKSDSTLGFRHGPKAIINEETLVILCNATDEYAKQYDNDLLAEMHEEGRVNMLVAYSLEPSSIKDVTHNTISPETYKGDKTITAILTYIIYGQIFAFFKSQSYGLTTDNPFPTGEVNRVVKKFKIYNY